MQKSPKKWRRYTGWQVAHLALTWLLWIGRLKCQVSFSLFQISLSLQVHTLLQLSNFNFFLMFILFVVDAWWRMYGGRVPLLQKLAIHILNQTCSSSGCERNWSVFEKIHNKMRNRLTLKNLKYFKFPNKILNSLNNIFFYNYYFMIFVQVGVPTT